jgi:hypothetical protein
MNRIWNRWVPRAIAALGGVLLCGAGALFVFAPPAGLMGFTVNNGDGMTNVRVAVGGFHAGVGLIGLVGAARPTLTYHALLFMVIAMAAVVASRVYGIALDGFGPISHKVWYREAGLLTALSIGLLLARAAHSRRNS